MPLTLLCEGKKMSLQITTAKRLFKLADKAERALKALVVELEITTVRAGGVHLQAMQINAAQAHWLTSNTLAMLNTALDEAGIK